MATAEDHQKKPPGTASEAMNPASDVVSAGELLAIELFTNTLLARTHFLFFLAALPDTLPYERNDLLEEARLALDEAEALCISGIYPIADELKAKCWYVKGFGAATNGDHQNATESYKKATEIDNEYEALEEVRRILYGQEDEDDVGETQNDASSDAGALYGRLASLHSLPRSINQPPFPQVESNDLSLGRPHSELYKYLFLETTEEAGSRPPSQLSTEDEVSRIVKELARRPPRRRSSYQAPPPVHMQPNPQLPAHPRETNGQKQEEARTKHQQPKDLHGSPRTTEAHLTPSPGEETLLSDTPSISKTEVDEALISNAASQNHQSSSKPTLHIQSNRQLSLSCPNSMPSSPNTPSPLRKASFPSDFPDHVE
ncbi:hypothetical protein LTS17_001983 [Exophiala oligosperma]